MKYKVQVLFAIVLLLIGCVILAQKAEAAKDNHFVITYSMADQKDEAIIRKVQAMFSGYGKTTQISLDELTEEQMKEASHIIYIGFTKDLLAKNKLALLEDSHLPLLLMGQNVQQFSAFKTIELTGSGKISSVNHHSLDKQVNLLKIKKHAGDVKSTGLQFDKEWPLIIQGKNAVYCALADINEEVQQYIQPILFDLLHVKTTNEKQAFAVIGNINPQTPKANLKKKVHILRQHNIPFLLALTPASVNSGNKTVVQFEDKKPLKDELLKLQKEGVAFIASGYSGEYESGISQQSMEFWNAKTNSPITSLEPYKAQKMKTQLAFPSEKTFDAYRVEIGAIEREYTQQRIESSVNSLTNNGLYPIAFSIHNGAGSSYVYQEIAQHFSTYFGEVSFSDENDQNRMVQSTITRPKFMGGITVYPYNLQVINRVDYHAAMMKTMLDQLVTIDQSVAGLFIDVSDDYKDLETSLSIIRQYPQFTWLDGRNITASVHTKHITIKQNKRGEQQLDLQNKYIYKVKQELQNKPFEFVLWCLFILVLLFVIIFFINVLRLRFTLKKRLFEERKPHG